MFSDRHSPVKLSTERSPASSGRVRSSALANASCSRDRLTNKLELDIEPLNYFSQRKVGVAWWDTISQRPS